MKNLTLFYMNCMHNCINSEYLSIDIQARFRPWFMNLMQIGHMQTSVININIKKIVI